MFVPRILRLLHCTGWEFWLPLPFISALFWFTGNFAVAEILNRSYGSVIKLQADMQMDVRPSRTILSMNAEIDRSRGVSTIFVRITDLTLGELKYEFPVTQASEIETAIAQKLELSTENIRKLLRYRLVD